MKPRRRILYVENDYGNVGGSILSLHAVVRHLDLERFEPWVTFAHGSPSPMVGAFEALGCRVVRLGRRLVRPPTPAHPETPLARLVGRTRSISRNLWKLARDDATRCAALVRILREHDVDLLHANSNLTSDLFAIVAARIAGVPVVVHQRAFGAPRPVTKPLLRTVARSIAISRAVQRDVEASLPAGVSVVVHNGTDIPETPPPIRPVRTPARIASVGRLVPWKGHHVVLRALPHVLERAPESEVWIAGAAVSAEDRSYEARLRNLVDDLGIAERVRFLGHVEDLRAHLEHDFDIVVHASVEPEPFGLVVVEAMAAGRPILAANAGACPEIVVHGESGLLYEAGDADALARELLRVIETEGLAESLARGGWERVRSRFDVRREAREIQALYDAILDAGSASRA